MWYNLSIVIKHKGKEDFINMSLLKSFSYGSYFGVDEIPEEVLNLFADSVQKGKKINYASEIIYSGLQGGIDLHNKFYLDAFEAAITHNNNLAWHKRKKKELYIDNNSDNDLEDTIKNGGIPEEKINIKKLRDDFEELIDNEELKFAISKIKSLNKEFIVVEQVDFIEAVKLAIRGLPKAIKEVKRLCEFYPKVGEYLEIILGSGQAFEEVFA